MGRQIPAKCLKCAALSAVQAKQQHGPEGDRCWDSTRCPSRRSYARHRDRINLKRSRQRRTPVDGPSRSELDWQQTVYAVLHIWREARENSPVHALGIVIWQGNETLATIPVIECVGAVPHQIHRYLENTLAQLTADYGIHKFAALSRHDPTTCPVRPCSLALHGTIE